MNYQNWGGDVAGTPEFTRSSRSVDNLGIPFATVLKLGQSCGDEPVQSDVNSG